MTDGHRMRGKAMSEVFLEKLDDMAIAEMKGERANPLDIKQHAIKIVEQHRNDYNGAEIDLILADLKARL